MKERISDKYYVVIDHGTMEQEVKGIPLKGKLFEGFDIFIHKNKGGWWKISDGETGLSFAKLISAKRSKEGAIKELKKRFDTREVRERINIVLLAHGYTKRYVENSRSLDIRILKND